MALAKVTKEISVGIVVSIGIVIFAVTIMAISKESRLFVAKVQFWTVFDNTSGLTLGSPVRLIGVQIGTVEKIGFDENVEESRIRVDFSVIQEGVEQRFFAHMLIGSSRIGIMPEPGPAFLAVVGLLGLLLAERRHGDR